MKKLYDARMKFQISPRIWSRLTAGAASAAATFMVAALVFIPSAALAQPAAAAPAVVAAEPPQLLSYRLGAGDQIRILVYNEPNLTGQYTVNDSGKIAFPLIGDVDALSRTTDQVRTDIETKLAAGYLRAPHVSIDVLVYRPFYILGEVVKPGDYPYSAGLTVLRAVAVAGGYTYRADRKDVFLKRDGETKEQRVPITGNLSVNPGDTVRIPERFF